MGIKQTLNYKVHTLSGNIASDVSITLNIKESNPKYLLHRAVINQNNASRQGTACSKTRSEVKGGGKKPWKQKGTGNARSGSSNSPLWKGGGVTFGPRPRSYAGKINTKEWRLALNTAIKNSFNKTVVIENLANDLDNPKTKKALEFFGKTCGELDNSKKTLIILPKVSENIYLSLRNIDNVTLLRSGALNVRDILLANKIIVTAEALKNIEEVYNG